MVALSPDATYFCIKFLLLRLDNWGSGHRIIRDNGIFLGFRVLARVQY